MPAAMIFCRFCGISDVRKFGRDRQRRQRYQCLCCGKIFTGRTRTVRSGSHLTDRQWGDAAKSFCKRTGESAADLARTMGVNRKTAQRINKTFRLLVKELEPACIPGFSEWDESSVTKRWVLGGVSRATAQCLLTCIPDRREDTLCPLVLAAAGPEGLVFTDEHNGYNGLYRRMTVCHEREFVNSQARFVHTNTQEGIWGHLKPLSWHVYRGIPSASLPQFLSECMFRYNIRDYETRLSVLSALLTRKINSLLV
jgi:transposase-like protein